MVIYIRYGKDPLILKYNYKQSVIIAIKLLKKVYLALFLPQSGTRFNTIREAIKSLWTEKKGTIYGAIID